MTGVVGGLGEAWTDGPVGQETGDEFRMSVAVEIQERDSGDGGSEMFENADRAGMSDAERERRVWNGGADVQRGDSGGRQMSIRGEYILRRRMDPNQMLDICLHYAQYSLHDGRGRDDEGDPFMRRPGERDRDGDTHMGGT
jgi:hypothetical protein